MNEQMKFPNGVYISVTMTSESCQNMLKYIDKHIIPHYPDLEFNYDQHVTIVYSKTPLNVSPILEKYKTSGKFSKFSLFGGNHDTLVAEIDCPKLTQRNKTLVKKYGFTSDWDEYKPHFTISYHTKNIDLNLLPPLDFPIEFELETIENLDLEWSN